MIAHACKPLTPDRQQLVTRAAWMVRWLAYPYVARHPEARDEIQGEGMLGLVRAAALFEEGWGTTFETYARGGITNGIKHALSKAYPRGYRRRCNRADAPGTVEYDGSAPYAVESIEGPHDQADERDEAEAWLDLMTPEEAAVMRAIYFGGRTIEEAADELAISANRARALRKSAIGRINP